jgi:hypothetical protein
MKLLDVLGTSSESFSLGAGEKKVEFRSINGVLHFRNFGTGWQKASSESLQESLRLRSWNSGLLLGQHELFIYNNSIWFSTISFISNNFQADSPNFIKVFDAENFLKINISSPITQNLLNTVSDKIYFSGFSNDAFKNINLPNAQTLNVARQFTFLNDSESDIRIYKHDDTSSYFQVKSKQSLGLILISNTSIQGDWLVLNYSGSSGGSGNYELEVTLNLNNYSGGTNPFTVNNIVYYKNNYWQKAISDNSDIKMIGIVTSVTTNKIKIAFSGQVEFTGVVLIDGVNPIVPGTLYYLSDTNPGFVTSSPGIINKKTYLAITTNSIFMIPETEYERFSEKKIYELNNGSSVNLNEGFSYKLDGFVQDDPNLTTFSGYIYNSTPTEGLIESSSDVVFDSDSSGGLCFFMDGNNLKMKNNLGSAKKIIIYRKKIK